jgi:hypothetical protein
MKDLRELDRYRSAIDEARVLRGQPNLSPSTGGVFRIRLKTSSSPFLIIVSNTEGWDHVSVSLPTRCPTWDEMEFIKRKFFRDDETVMQLHVAVADHRSFHPYCLHLWRPQNIAIPLPPGNMVAPKMETI